MDSVLPTTDPLDFALVRYRKALACLNAPKTSLSTEQALEILLARDGLQNALKAQEQVPAELLSQLIQLDSQLKKKADRILAVLYLPDCRESLPAPRC
jgi:hypothetical protein